MYWKLPAMCWPAPGVQISISYHSTVPRSSTQQLDLYRKFSTNFIPWCFLILFLKKAVFNPLENCVLRTFFSSPDLWDCLHYMNKWLLWVWMSAETSYFIQIQFEMKTSRMLSCNGLSQEIISITFVSKKKFAKIIGQFHIHI